MCVGVCAHVFTVTLFTVNLTYTQVNKAEEPHLCELSAVKENMLILVRTLVPQRL